MSYSTLIGAMRFLWAGGLDTRRYLRRLECRQGFSSQELET